MFSVIRRRYSPNYSCYTLLVNLFSYWSKVNPDWVIETERRGLKGNQVMVWAGVIDHHTIGPYFFEANVNGDNYLDMLQNFVIPELNELQIDSKTIWFQQNGASSHYTRNVRAFCDWIGRGGSINWPARSPDHNPMDAFVWPYLKAKVYKDPRPRNMDELKEKITNELVNISQDTRQNVINHTMRRLEKCIEAEDGHVTKHMVR